MINPSLSERLTNIPSTERVYEDRYANLILKYFNFKLTLDDDILSMFYVSTIDVEVRIDVDSYLTNNYKKRYLYLNHLVNNFVTDVEAYKKHKIENTLKNKIRKFFNKLFS